MLQRSKKSPSCSPTRRSTSPTHHRYETMVALREELRAESGGNPRSSIEYGTIFLANMDDPGLLVFPTHRVVHGLPSFDRAAVLRAAKMFFTVEEVATPDAA